MSASIFFLIFSLCQKRFYQNECNAIQSIMYSKKKQVMHMQQRPIHLEGKKKVKNVLRNRLLFRVWCFCEVKKEGVMKKPTNQLKMKTNGCNVINPEKKAIHWRKKTDENSVHMRYVQMEIQLLAKPEFKGNSFTMTLTRHIHIRMEPFTSANVSVRVYKLCHLAKCFPLHMCCGGMCRKKKKWEWGIRMLVN